MEVEGLRSMVKKSSHAQNHKSKNGNHSEYPKLGESENTMMEGEQLASYIEDIAETVRAGIDQSISILTPWFFNNMPQMYYQTTPRAEKVRHLSSLISGHIFETKQTVELWDRDHSKVTYIGPGNDRRILFEIAHKLQTQQLKMGSVYFSKDNLLCLATFFTRQYIPLDLKNSRITEKLEKAKDTLLQELGSDKSSVEHYLKNLDNDFVTYATLNRLVTTFKMLNYMTDHEGAHTIYEPIQNSDRARLTVMIKNMEMGLILEPMVQLLQRYGFKITRSFGIRFEHGYSDPVSILYFVLTHPSGDYKTSDSIPVMRLTKALRTLAWVDVDNFAVFSREPYNLSINAVNLIRAMSVWNHIFLGKINPYYYSQYKIHSTFLKHSSVTLELVELFRVKFDPLKSAERKNKGYDGYRKELMIKIDEIIDEIERDIFKQSVHFVDHILKTNYFLPTKTGLAFRLDPKVLDQRHYAQIPFGFFFIIGRDYRFFHVRWREIARGGIRVVIPRSEADYEYALAGLFDEVYGLSYAQQQKNKDIPEGGSKGVMLLSVGGSRDVAVRGAINALLDLLVSEDESHEGKISQLVNYYDKEEIIYLGPDENITNDLIDWIPAQAKRRGYRYALAFMSSKPKAGINHKEYGVTSEGLNVFVHNMLEFIGVNPKQDRFRVKITGGPDGDVAGNELKILYREYGENARVVAVADGFGAAYDPNGLDWKELIRLFKDSKSIAEFDSQCLSSDKNSYVIKADNKENIRMRNQLYAKAEADIFIPGGGRPYTVNERNWKDFFLSDGKPSAKAIVEGANIFFTSEAREKIQEKGVLIIKDSSANKTGVVCSSFEIIASLILEAEEFVNIKKTYVEQVLDILRQKADYEAKLLFREYSRYAGEKTLVQLSLEISREINDLTDVVLNGLEKNPEQVLKENIFQEIILSHCPKILVQKYKDRIEDRLPLAHKIAIIAANVASYIVYREGLGWFSRIPKDEQFDIAKLYIKNDRMTQNLIDAIQTSNISNKENLVSIIQMSAARDLTLLELSKTATNK